MILHFLDKKTKLDNNLDIIIIIIIIIIIFTEGAQLAKAVFSGKGHLLINKYYFFLGCIFL